MGKPHCLTITFTMFSIDSWRWHSIKTEPVHASTRRRHLHFFNSTSIEHRHTLRSVLTSSCATPRPLLTSQSSISSGSSLSRGSCFAPWRSGALLFPPLSSSHSRHDSLEILFSPGHKASKLSFSLLVHHCVERKKFEKKTNTTTKRDPTHNTNTEITYEEYFSRQKTQQTKKW